MPIINKSITDFLTLSYSIKTNPNFLKVGHSLNLSGSVSSNQKLQDIKHFVSVNTSIKARTSILQKSISDRLEFRDKITRPKSATLTHYLQFTEKIIRPKTGTVAHTLSFAQTYNSPGNIVTSKLNLLSTITHKLIYLRPLTSTLTFESNQHGYILDYKDILITLPTLTEKITVRFTNGSTILDLRVPVFNDNEKMNFYKIERESRGKELLLYRDNIWPKLTTLNMTFEYLKETDTRKLIDFMKQNLGKDITFIDQYNRTWTGIFMEPVANIKQQGRSNFVADIVFEGELN